MSQKGDEIPSTSEQDLSNRGSREALTQMGTSEDLTQMDTGENLAQMDGAISSSVADELEFSNFQSGGSAKPVLFKRERNSGRRALPNEKVRAERRAAIETLRFLHTTCFACGLNSRWIMWSNTFFMAGNILYILLAVFDLETLNMDLLDVGDSDPQDGFPSIVNGTLDETLRNFATNKTVYNSVNVAGAILFILNPLSDFMGAWAENKVREINAMLDKNHYEEREQRASSTTEEVSTGQANGDAVGTNDLRSGLCDFDPEEVDWEKHVAIVFLLGSLLYLWQAFEDMRDDPPFYYVGLDMVASLTMLFDSVLGVISWYVAKGLDAGTSRERSLFTVLPFYLDWSGWGDWLFFAGSVLDTAVSFMATYPLKTQRILALVSSLLWLIDALFYIIGYIFGQDVRKRLGNEYYSSLRHVEEDAGLDSLENHPSVELTERLHVAGDAHSEVVMI